MVEPAAVSYDVPFEMKKNFTPQEVTEMIKSFKIYDANKDGTISASEFKTVLVDMGHREVTQEQVQEMLSKVDLNKDGVI